MAEAGGSKSISSFSNNGNTTVTLGGGASFTKNESVNVGYLLSASQTANYWIGTYYLTNIATSQTFTNSVTWNGTRY